MDLSAQVAECLKHMAEKARRVDELVGEIAAASTEQDRGIEQVSDAIGQVDKVTQANASTAEEAAAADELTAQSAALRQSVGTLVALVGANDAPVQLGRPEIHREAKATEHHAPPSSQRRALPPRTMNRQKIFQREAAAPAQIQEEASRLQAEPRIIKSIGLER